MGIFKTQWGQRYGNFICICLINIKNLSLHANPLAQILGEVKIMKEFVWINWIFFGFWASRWKKLRQRLESYISNYLNLSHFFSGVNTLLNQVSWELKTYNLDDFPMVDVILKLRYLEHFQIWLQNWFMK